MRAPWPRRLVPPGAALATLLAALAIAGLFAVLTAPAYDQVGGPFDEGTLLAYPVEVLDGAVPHRDFEFFHGPGSPWLLAGVYELTGASLGAERAVGFAYATVVVLSLFLLCLPWGRATAAASAAIAAVLLVPFELQAVAALGALAFGLLALVVMLAGERRTQNGGATRFLLAGMLAGAGALLRPDFLPALVVCAAPPLIATTSRSRRRYGAGLLIALLPYVIHAVLVGREKIEKLVSDLVSSSSGRRLPIELTSSEPGKLLLLTVAAAAISIALAARARGSEPRVEGRTLLSVALLTVALLPYALSRLDYIPHLGVAGIPALSLLPVAAASVSGAPRRRAAALAGPVTAVAVAVVLFSLAPDSIEGPVRKHVDRLRGRIGDGSEVVAMDGRRYRVVAGDEAHNVRRVLVGAEQARRGGARTLFVGPRDLRRTNANDTFLYYLLADFKPASYYMELNPRTANRAGSGLPAEVRSADVLILNRRWDAWNEPNDSRILGPAAPNRVVDRYFCRQLRAGTYELFRRCRPSRRQAAAG
jgi:hypothetical protein